MDKVSVSGLEGSGRRRSSERDSLEEPMLGILQLGVRTWHKLPEKVEMKTELRVKCSLHPGRVRSAKWKMPEGQSFGSSIEGV